MGKPYSTLTFNAEQCLDETRQLLLLSSKLKCFVSRRFVLSFHPPANCRVYCHSKYFDLLSCLLSASEEMRSNDVAAAAAALQIFSKPTNPSRECNCFTTADNPGGLQNISDGSLKGTRVRHEFLLPAANFGAATIRFLFSSTI